MTTTARDDQPGLEYAVSAEDLRASAAEHRARAHELRAGVNGADQLEEGGGDAYLHAGIDERLAAVADLRASALEAREGGDLGRADELEQQVVALSADREGETERHEAWAESHARLALVHQPRAQGLTELAEASSAEAGKLR